MTISESDKEEEEEVVGDKPAASVQAARTGGQVHRLAARRRLLLRQVKSSECLTSKRDGKVGPKERKIAWKKLGF